MASLYNTLRAKGVNLDWYHRAKGLSTEQNANIIPLDTASCCRTSIYLLKPDGSLWTTSIGPKGGGLAFKKVREASKPIPHAIYYCACCKGQWNDYKAAVAHTETVG